MHPSWSSRALVGWALRRRPANWLTDMQRVPSFNSGCGTHADRHQAVARRIEDALG